MSDEDEEEYVLVNSKQAFSTQDILNTSECYTKWINFLGEDDSWYTRMASSWVLTLFYNFYDRMKRYSTPYFENEFIQFIVFLLCSTVYEDSYHQNTSLDAGCKTIFSFFTVYLFHKLTLVVLTLPGLLLKLLGIAVTWLVMTKTVSHLEDIKPYAVYTLLLAGALLVVLAQSPKSFLNTVDTHANALIGKN